MLLGSESLAGQPPTPQVEVVTKLYKDFAYEAVIEEPSNATGFIDSPREVLLSYLMPGLADLILKDRKCAADTREICNLDFMPLWGSQDAAGVTVRISSTNANDKVKVQLKYGVGSRMVTYSLAITKQGWRIQDIGYEKGRASLVQILTPTK